MNVCLEILPPGQAAYSVEFPGPQIFIGRDPGCELPLGGNTSQSVSWRHAQVHLTPEGAFVTDLQSSNGTFVNGVRVDKAARLRQGDQISLGKKGPKLRITRLELAEHLPTVVETSTSARGGEIPHSLVAPAPPPRPPAIAPPAPPPAAAAPAAGGPTPTRQLLLHMASRQRKLWLLFSLGAAVVVTGLVMTLLILNKLSKRQVGEEVYKSTLPSTVWIRVDEGQGTGALIDRKKKIVLTAYHVIAETKKVEVFFPAFDNAKKVIADQDHYLKKMAPIPAKVLLADPSLDLALLVLDSLPEGAEELRLASTSSKPGERVHTVGNPKASGGLWVYTSGTVRQVIQKAVTLPGGQRVKAWSLEMQNPINQGDSGGPVVNDQGELVGVNSSALFEGAQLMSDAIDVREVWALLRRLDE
jgi:S1-C subfamily serine protease